MFKIKNKLKRTKQMKLKAQDLQIGDWVLSENEPNIIAEVSEIVQGEAEVCFAGTNYMANTDEIKPIPITPEILEKNGFEFIVFNEDWKKEYAYKSEDTYVSVIFIEGKILVKMETRSKVDIGVNNLHNCDIKYIHQLQQALRLCKIRKGIKL